MHADAYRTAHPLQGVQKILIPFSVPSISTPFLPEICRRQTVRQEESLGFVSGLKGFCVDFPNLKKGNEIRLHNNK